MQGNALVAAADLDPVLSIVHLRHEDDHACGTAQLLCALLVLGFRREQRAEQPSPEPSRDSRIACRAGEQSIACAHGLSLTEANPRLEFLDERSIADLGRVAARDVV